MKPSVAVLGSINMDLVAKVKRFPKPGETISGSSFDQLPGGKGANQAVATARMGADVSMYGAVGKDGFGSKLLESLQESGIKTDKVARLIGSTGVALITVDESGENKIVIIAGANGEVDQSYCDEIIENLAEFDVILTQLEIPLPTIVYALTKISKLSTPGPTTILDPAPAIPAHKLPLDSIDILTPNQTELEILLGSDSKINKPKQLFDKGLGSLVIKRGEEGCELITNERSLSLASFKVDALDTTAAGDAFNGALADSLARGEDLKTALEIANAAGASATLKQGAQTSMPSRKKVQQVLNKESERNYEETGDQF